MEVHIGEKIKIRARELKIGSTELGKLINTSKQNIYGIFKRPSIDTEMLAKISKALKHDFFQYYELSELKDNSLQLKLNDSLDELEQLKAENNDLKEKVELLKRLNELLETKSKN